MSVWLRQADRWHRLEPLARWRRPPVVAPPAATLRALVRERAGVPASEAPASPTRTALDSALAESPAGGPFARKAASARSVALAIPDATRRGVGLDWVSAVAAWLSAMTPRAERRSLLVAGGVHRPQASSRTAPAEGWDLAINGETDPRQSHRDQGTTSRGTPVRLHGAWVEAELKVALGDVSYHYFAGFGGGRKLVFPGLGESVGILANHKLSLGVDGLLHPACEPGRLDGNPVHEDLMEAVSFSPPDLLVQWVETEPGGPTLLQVGDWRDQHAAGCRVYLAGHRLAHTARPRALMVDAGGHPRDATFLQAHKSLQHAVRFLPNGGKLLLVAGLEEGVGSAVLERLWGKPSGELAQIARERYELHTHTALAFATVRERCEVGVWTAGDPAQMRGAGVAVFTGAEEALDWITAGRDPETWGWIPRAEEWLPRLVGKSEGTHAAVGAQEPTHPS